jgi:hypothetical protein
VRVIHALIEGLVMQRFLTPELCPEEVFDAAFAALARQGRVAGSSDWAGARPEETP